MKRIPITLTADAPLSLIIQRLQANDYFANFNVPDGENVIRFDNIKKKNYIYFYFINNTYANHIKRIKDMVISLEMPYTNTALFEPKLVRNLIMISCYLEEDISQNKVIKTLGIRKSWYNFFYSFIFSFKEQKIVLLKPGLFSSSKHRSYNELIKMMFNVEYKKKPSK